MQVMITLTLVADGPQDDPEEIARVVQEGLNGDLLTLDGVHVEPGTCEIAVIEPLP